jgi:hypothetical protein
VPRQTDLICTPQRRAAMMPKATPLNKQRECRTMLVLFRESWELPKRGQR